MELKAGYKRTEVGVISGDWEVKELGDIGDIATGTPPPNNKNNYDEGYFFAIRSLQVVLDKDLAQFTEVQPICLREQVKRIANRFPDDFMFQLTEIEADFMVSHFAMPSKQRLGEYFPYVITEQGVSMLSSVNYKLN